MSVAIDITLNFGRPERCRLVVGRGTIQESGRVFERTVGGDRVAWVSDTTVRDLLGATMADVLGRSFGRVDWVEISPGESAKTLGHFSTLIDRLHAIGVDRRTTLVAVGGGSVTDTVGFVAACYLRGISYVNVPTTLTGQVDAAVGGKVAVNTADAKNLVGAFYHPRAVVIDPTVISDADVLTWRDGMAEVLKVGLIADERLFAIVERGTRAIADDAGLTDDMVIRALMAKLALLTPDPFEADLDRLLNFGHETAHALETTVEHKITHGCAVAIGIATASRIAWQRGLLTATQFDRVIRTLHRHDLPTTWQPLIGELARFADSLATVALVRGGNLRVVLPTGIGSGMVSSDVDIADLCTAVVMDDQAA